MSALEREFQFFLIENCQSYNFPLKTSGFTKDSALSTGNALFSLLIIPSESVQQ